ncbi:MAG: hypothetical protein E6R14_04530 [Thermomicrobiales bacterium]|nr:MAG: hypothetical protein E6R14_04530 [Thermomicrobiales bacterium]
MAKQFGFGRALSALVVLAALLLASVPAGGASAQVSGTTYISPNYGYTITWRLPWYVTESDTDANGFDVLGLADSQSFVYFSGGETSGGPAEVIEQYADQLASDPSSSGFAPVNDPQCAASGDGVSSVAACYRFDLVSDGGISQSFGVMLKTWELGNGLDLLLEAYTDEALLSSFIPHWNEFGVYPPGLTVPTPSANTCQTEVIHGISYCLDPALSARDRSDIIEGVRMGQDAIAAYFGNPDLGSVQITGLQGVSPFGDGLLGTTRDRSIAIYAGSVVWSNVTPVERIETLVHEFFHIYQNVMTEENESPVPLWFTEGSAEAVGFMTVAQLGVTDQSEFYEMTSYSLTVSPFGGTLADLETPDSMGADAYPLAYVAVQYLLGSRGMAVTALGDVYALMADGTRFDDAFTQVFGLTPDQFSVEFEAWRPRFQQVTELPDDFYPPNGTLTTGAVTLGVAPQTVARDDQLFVVAMTEALATCAASVQAPGFAIERETIANGEGSVFWLFSIPPGAPTGTAQVTVDCGAGPASMSIAIT